MANGLHSQQSIEKNMHVNLTNFLHYADVEQPIRGCRIQHNNIKKGNRKILCFSSQFHFDCIRYYTGPVNSPESAEFMGPETMDIQPGDWLLVISFL